MTKYSKKAQEKVHLAMHEYKNHNLKLGISNKTVKNKKQAIAIGLSEAKKAVYKVPTK